MGTDPSPVRTVAAQAGEISNCTLEKTLET
jgi:hypothetical protein